MAAELSLLFTLKAKNEASATLKQLETSISMVKDRIKEIKNEAKGEIPFKTERLDAMTSRLKALTEQHKELKKSTEDAAKSLENDLGGALSTVSPQLAGLVGAAGPVTLLAIGFAAAAAAGAALAVSIFDLAQSTAEFQGKNQDLSQQLGISTETLSGLEVIASNTGGTIESISGSLGIFQKNLEASHDSTSKESILLNKLGVTSLDAETALRQTLKGLYDMGEGAAQTTAVLDLFGRSGRFVNAILKESHGNLDEALGGFRDLGLEISGGAALAADQFNDSYNLMQRQLTALTHQIVGDTIPIFTLLFQDISKGLTGSENDWVSWSGVVEVETAAAIAAIQTFVQYVASRGSLSPDVLFNNNMQGLLDRADKLKNKLNFEADVARIQRVTSSILAGRPGDNVGVAPKKAGKSEEEKQAEQALKFWEQLARELGVVTDAFLGVSTASKTYSVQQEINNGVLSKASNELKGLALDAAANFDYITKQTKLSKELEAFFKKQAEAIRLVVEGEKSYYEQAVMTIDALEKEGLAVDVTQTFWAKFNGLIIDLGENLKDLPSKLREVAAAAAEAGPQFKADDRPIDTSGAGNAPPIPGLFQPGQNVFDDIQHQLKETLGLSNELASGLTDGLAASFKLVAQGIGETVEAFVLLGTAGGGLRKFTAEFIAQIAKMAAVQAIWELAQGLAMLALNFFWPDPKLAASATAHLHAAAVYGGIAGIAAAAGRGVAGDAFKQSPAAGGGASGGSAGGSRNTSTAPTGIDTSRPVFQSPSNQVTGGQLTVKIQPPAGWVGEEFRKDYLLNGVTRLTIVTDG